MRTGRSRRSRTQSIISASGSDGGPSPPGPSGGRIGATKDWKKELLAIQDGYRESEQSWKELLLDLKVRGLSVDPRLAVGDGALGFWKALPEVFGTTKTQRCWVHKTANILNKLPKAKQPKAKSDLHQIWMAEKREGANKAFDYFLSAYQAKYPKATECLKKARRASETPFCLLADP